MSDRCCLVDIILHLLADPFLSFARHAYVTPQLSIASAAGFQWEVSDVRYRAQSTRARVYRSVTNFRHSKYIIRVYRTRCTRTREKWMKTNRPLRGPDVELYGNERQIAITSPRREDTCCLEVDSQSANMRM